ncbi:MAG: hypothetical protein Q8O42_11240 [Acidobacteriota bacterium]|nr:hypothetical protein [Acidobacteriota bacterium]
MKEPNKCAHPACKCLVPDNGAHGKYCSAHCEMAKDVSELKCDCGHPGC